MAHPGAQISKRRKFVADGVFYAELNEFFQRELAEEGYSGVEVRVTPTVTDIIIRATQTQEKRFKFPENSVSSVRRQVQNRGLFRRRPQCESLRYKLLNGLAVRRACYGVLRFIMESGAKGCGGSRLRQAPPPRSSIDTATRHVLLRQGVLGIKVKIMRGSDPDGQGRSFQVPPDAVTIFEPKEEQVVLQPVSQDYGAKAAAAQASQDARVAEQEGEAEPAQQ
ncbi:40S ribosomal protein S3 [Metarhizium acridum]|nr:40S ribosomal protein S3 [Metarhizium acridum]